MPDHAHILGQRWTDILPPTVPAAVNSELVFAAIVLLLLAVLGVALLWQLRPRQSARRALRRFRRQLRTGGANADTRMIAYHTYRAILDGLSLTPAQRHRLAQDVGPWGGFHRRLQVCVFSANPPSREEMLELIGDGLYWLRHAATR